MRRRLLPFLGSMDLAITLLVMLSIASVIGTLIRQGESWTNYQIKFGPFWFEVFRILQIYDVYSAPWFLCVLTFLLISTSLCIWHHTPAFIRELRSIPYRHTTDTLQKLRWHAIYNQLTDTHYLSSMMQQAGFKVRTEEGSDGQYLYGVQGKYNRIGYWLTHFGIIIICLGALMDTSLPFKWSIYTGEKQVETRTLPINDVPKKSWIELSNPAFRGTVDIPEGRSSNVIFLPYQDGYFVQKLPFNIEVKDFNIEHYPTGQPKSFQSQLRIYDLAGNFRTSSTIEVNKPLLVDGIAIYQSSFSDGGSEIHFNSWDWGNNTTSTIHTAIHDTQTISGHDLQLEMRDFRLFNIQNIDEQNTHNNGPSVLFRLRDKTGQAIEYENFMLPIKREERYFFLSGVRSKIDEEFRYLYIPADSNNSIKRFMAFNFRIHNDNYLRQHFISKSSIDATSSSLEQEFMVNIIRVFRNQGFGGIEQYLQAMSAEQRKSIEETVLDLLKVALSAVYVQTLSEEESIPPESMNDFDFSFFDDAVFAISALSRYEAPFYLELKNFKHIQSSGLQLTRSPGKLVVYLGCLMLIIGIFILFYMRRARIFFAQNRQEQKTVLAIDYVKNDTDRARLMEQAKQWIESAP